MHVPYFRVSLILAILWFIAGIASVWSPGISSYFVINIIRILSSGIALALCFHAVSRNRDEVLYMILTFAIACIFLNDIYSFAHYLVVGAFLDYFIILLPYLGAVAFMAVLKWLFDVLSGKHMLTSKADSPTLHAHPSYSAGTHIPESSSV